MDMMCAALMGLLITILDTSKREIWKNSVADTERAKRVLGYYPLVPLRNGLAQEFEYIVSLYTYARSAVS